MDHAMALIFIIKLRLPLRLYCHCEGGYQPTAAIQANNHCAYGYQSPLRSFQMRIRIFNCLKPASRDCDYATDIRLEWKMSLRSVASSLHSSQ